MFRRILPNFAPVINNKTYSHEKDIHSTIGAQCHLENQVCGTHPVSYTHLDVYKRQQVKVEKHQVRKVLQECWKLTPASNGLTYTTYRCV